ncbi:MAG: 3-deoxy-7-phosphoheptulonate synthase [Polyangiaceae bacterium]
MIVTLKPGAEVSRVLGELAARGLWVSALERAPGEPALLLVAPHSAQVDPRELGGIEGVLGVAAPKPQHPRVTAQRARVTVAGVPIGGGAEPVWMCGPCSVESEQHARELAEQLRPLGVLFLRGGAFKPRTSPYAFQGHGEPALGWLRRAADATGMRVVTEALGEEHVAPVAEHADMVQVGSRNMQSFALLKAVGRAGKPVLLKRGMAATVEEWLLAGEYLLQHGAPVVVFCERGIRSFDASTRNLIDLGAVALLSHVYHQPVIVDPSHAAGRRDLVAPLARAAIAAGAAGLMVETHADPAHALSDGPQALPLAELARLVGEIKRGQPDGGVS